MEIMNCIDGLFLFVLNICPDTERIISVTSLLILDVQRLSQ